MHPHEPKYCDPRAFDGFRKSLSVLEDPTGVFSAAVAIALHFLPQQPLRASFESVIELSSTVRSRVRHASPQALLARLHEVLFDECGFVGNVGDYYAVENSLIPTVLQTKRGIPISLSLIYYTVGRLAGLRIEGVNSPGHFLVRVHLEHDTMLVDPFHSGRVLSAVEGVALIEEVLQQPWENDEDWFPTCPPKQWLHRMLGNLRSTLIHSGNSRDVAAVRELQRLLNDAT